MSHKNDKPVWVNKNPVMYTVHCYLQNSVSKVNLFEAKLLNLRIFKKYILPPVIKLKESVIKKKCKSSRNVYVTGDAPRHRDKCDLHKKLATAM